MSAAVYTAVRYLISWACIWLAGHGWTVANLDGATMDAVTQIAIGVGGAIAMAAIGIWRSTVPALLARLKANHKPALLAAAGDVSLTKATEILTAASNVVGVQKIITEPGLAAATPSDKVVPTLPGQA